jgi:hypothetical protein
MGEGMRTEHVKDHVSTWPYRKELATSDLVPGVYSVELSVSGQQLAVERFTVE